MLKGKAQKNQSILPEVTDGEEFQDFTAIIMKFNANKNNATAIVVWKISRNLMLIIGESSLPNKPPVVHTIEPSTEQ